MKNVPRRATGEAMSEITRRDFLRSTGGAVVLGAGIAATPSTAAEHPDADLLALGAEFDRAFAAYKVASKKANEAEEAFKATHGPYQFGDSLGAVAYGAKLRQQVGPIVDLLEEAHTTADALSSRIRSIAPKTLAGVAVKARTLRHDLCRWGDNPQPLSEWDWSDQCLESFIRDMQKLGGGLV